MQGDVYDTDCRVVDGLSTTENVCNDGIFSCSPAPITFTRYRNSFTHLSYACRTDSRAGSCGGNAISVCVSLPPLRFAHQIESWAVSARVDLEYIQLTRMPSAVTMGTDWWLPSSRDLSWNYLKRNSLTKTFRQRSLSRNSPKTSWMKMLQGPTEHESRGDISNAKGNGERKQ